jgi:riboflavin synthase
VFTGIIEEVGRVVSAVKKGGGMRLSIDAPQLTPELNVDDSVSVNGVCQTVVAREGTRFSVQAVEETLRKTTLGILTSGSPVNLELSVRLSDRLGGHLVQGHVDCVGQVISVEKESSSWLITVEFPKEFAKYVIPVGSIAMDGISLTVARTESNRLTVAIIPHTLEKTSVSNVRSGSRVNLEFDLIGKYVEKLIQGGVGPRGLTLSEGLLRGWGYER